MTIKILITLIFIIPISGASYTLFKYSYRYNILRKKNLNNKELSKSTMLKMFFSFIAGIAGSTLAVLWLIILWVPNVQLPLYMKIIFGVLVIHFGIFLSLLGGLAKTMEAGGSSVSGVMNSLSNKISQDSSDND